MTTPREILLSRHQAALPKLDTLRAAALTTMSQPVEPWPPAAFWLLAWRELFLPVRFAWSGLAAIWVLLIAVNFFQHKASSQTKSVSAPMGVSFHEQQRMLNELLADRTPINPDADRQKISPPKPHTELTRIEFV